MKIVKIRRRISFSRYLKPGSSNIYLSSPLTPTAEKGKQGWIFLVPDYARSEIVITCIIFMNHDVLLLDVHFDYICHFTSCKAEKISRIMWIYNVIWRLRSYIYRWICCSKIVQTCSCIVDVTDYQLVMGKNIWWSENLIGHKCQNVCWMKDFTFVIRISPIKPKQAFIARKTLVKLWS